MEECVVFPGCEGASVTASGNYYDGNCESLLEENGYWNAGAHPPQWVQIDLGQVYPISHVNLVVEQLPLESRTVHKFKAGEMLDQLEEIKVLDSTTKCGERLRVEFTPIDARYLRIETITSPSWVAWRSIEICTWRSKAKSARK